MVVDAEMVLSVSATCRQRHSDVHINISLTVAVVMTNFELV
jgi:hypothetical protein